MTHDELHALPEWFLFSSRTEVRDGRTVNVPVMNSPGAQWYEDGEPMTAVDADGVRWTLVKVEGVRYRVRA